MSSGNPASYSFRSASSIFSTSTRQKPNACAHCRPASLIKVHGLTGLQQEVISATLSRDSACHHGNLHDRAAPGGRRWRAPLHWRRRFLPVIHRDPHLVWVERHLGFRLARLGGFAPALLRPTSADDRTDISGRHERPRQQQAHSPRLTQTKLTKVKVRPGFYRPVYLSRSSLFDVRYFFEPTEEPPWVFTTPLRHVGLRPSSGPG